MFALSERARISYYFCNHARGTQSDPHPTLVEWPPCQVTGPLWSSSLCPGTLARMLHHSGTGLQEHHTVGITSSRQYQEGIQLCHGQATRFQSYYCCSCRWNRWYSSVKMGAAKRVCVGWVRVYRTVFEYQILGNKKKRKRKWKITHELSVSPVAR